MKKRLLSFVLTGILVFTLAIGVLPMRAGAVLPVGFVESAFASYAMSSGYTFFSEEMDDPLFLGLFRELYDDFVTVKSALGQTIRRWDEYDNRDVYLDRSGNIVVSYGVAQDWAGAMEWIQSHYDIEDGGEEVTVVPSISGGTQVTSGLSIPGVTYPFNISNDVSTFNFVSFEATSPNTPWWYHSVETNLPCKWGYFVYPDGYGVLVVANASTFKAKSNTAFFSSLESGSYPDLSNVSYGSSAGRRTVNGKTFYSTSFTYHMYSAVQSSNVVNADLQSQVNNIAYSMLYGDISQAQGVAGLAVSIGTSITDVAQGMTDDDAVVIGVGAVPGITEGEMADFIADGIRADTLEPTATITATDVIDTPVQPYPDIDGLGLPLLGAALTSRFPFCIPWDFVDTVQLLAADPVAPDFSFDLLPQRIRDYCHITASTEVRFNMGDPKFSKVGVFCRWGSLISFCFGLAVLTKRMIWTA